MDARNAWTEAHAATDQGLVEGVVATLALPRGPLDAAALACWRDGLAARGWSPIEGDAADFPRPDAPPPDRYRLRHAASGCGVDVRVRPHDPATPRDLTVDAVVDAAHRRYTFSTVRLYGPEGSDLLADANLVDAQPNGTVTWLVSSPVPRPESPSDRDTLRTATGDATDAGTPRTATANPFRRRVRLPALLRPGSVPSPRVAALGLAGLALLFLGCGVLWHARTGRTPR